MRRVLVDHARKRKRVKRGAGRKRVTLSTSMALCGDADVDVCAVDAALERLVGHDERAARIVEMLYFGGLTQDDAARSLGISVRLLEQDWTHARAWLRRELLNTG